VQSSVILIIIIKLIFLSPSVVTSFSSLCVVFGTSGCYFIVPHTSKEHFVFAVLLTSLGHCHGLQLQLLDVDDTKFFEVVTILTVPGARVAQELV
jgi:hypothetical protein